MSRIATAAGILFGFMMVGLSLLVATETIMRKLFNMSFQGADELGGYALAVGSALAFSVALVGRAHIRIDLLHVRMPPRVQAFLNWLSLGLIAAFGLLLVRVCWTILSDTLAYHSTAATPWATPLIWPQAFWYGGLVLFALLAVAFWVRASLLLGRGEMRALNRAFGPHSAEDELREELEDLKQR